MPVGTTPRVGQSKVSFWQRGEIKLCSLNKKQLSHGMPAVSKCTRHRTAGQSERGTQRAFQVELQRTVYNQFAQFSTGQRHLLHWTPGPNSNDVDLSLTVHIYIARAIHGRNKKAAIRLRARNGESKL